MEAAEVLRVLDALERAGVRAGLTGGWGVDALLGRQTRPHGDADLGIRQEQIDAATAALATLGYVVTADERPARLVLGSPVGQVDLHPIEVDAAGVGIQRGRSGERFDYPAGSLEADGVIDGHPVRCGTPELQLTFHSHYDPREHDLADMQALADAFEVELPASYRRR
jgi:lincosamide nucleotidyltransferase A/C/D/E